MRLSDNALYDAVEGRRVRLLGCLGRRYEFLRASLRMGFARCGELLGSKAGAGVYQLQQDQEGEIRNGWRECWGFYGGMSRPSGSNNVQGFATILFTR